MGGKTKNHIKKTLRTKFKGIRTWQLILVFIPLAFVVATLLRFDHLKMTELRDQVLAADASGDEAKLSQALTELRDFTYTHIVVNLQDNNGDRELFFGTGPFYLENQYLRLANAAIEEAQNNLADDSNPNGNIYAAVGDICKTLAIQNGWQWNDQANLDCWTSELAKYPTMDDLSVSLTANVPSTELFRYNYASPVWAPTYAGILLLVASVLFFIILIRAIIWLVLKIALLFLK